MDEEVRRFPAPAPGTKMNIRDAMKLAIAEGFKGAPFVSPNPLVGCVILDREGRLLSVGHHARYGGPHAEAAAAQTLSDSQIEGATVIVTLEPCAHEGKTPSCAKMLVRRKVGSVIFGLEDPNPLVAGQGAALLREAGINARVFRDHEGDFSLDDQLEELAEAFLWNFRHQSLFVGLKVASSLDGRVALASGESKWITGPEARLKGHELRAFHDATLVGSGTIQLDDPQLDVRHPSYEKSNRVVVLDSRGELLRKWRDLAVFKAHEPRSLHWVVDERAEIRALPEGVLLHRVKSDASGLEFESVFQSLWGAGLRSVLVEGGARVSSALLREGRVNRLHLFQAPVLLGAAGARLWSEDLPISSMDSRPTLLRPRTQVLGRDLYWTGLLQDPRRATPCRGM